MSTHFQHSRRRFMHLTSLGLLGVAATPAWVRAMEMAPSVNKANPAFKADVEIDLFTQTDSLAILPGKPTQVYRYTAKLLSGPKETLAEIPGSYGPDYSPAEGAEGPDQLSQQAA